MLDIKKKKKKKKEGENLLGEGWAVPFGRPLLAATVPEHRRIQIKSEALWLILEKWQLPAPHRPPKCLDGSLAEAGKKGSVSFRASLEVVSGVAAPFRPRLFAQNDAFLNFGVQAERKLASEFHAKRR